MRIGIDCRLWNETGVGRYIRNLVGQLAHIDSKNEYVLFILSKDSDEILKQVQNDNFRLVKADIRWHSIDEQLRFTSIINKEKLDLVHFPYFSVPLFYNKPFVITIHDLILHNFPTGKASTLPLPLYQLKLAAYKFILSQAAKRAKKIITVSHATEDEIVKKLGVSKEKIVVTYEGIDAGLYSSSGAKRNREEKKFSTRRVPYGNPSSSNNNPYFLYVGNSYPHKNLERLVEAFVQIRETNKEVSLIFVGKEDYFYKRLKQKVAAIGLSESILFYEKITDEELSELYRHAIALVAPSLMEGFSLPPLEALANDCLVVASDIPAHKEICKDVPLYFNPNSKESLVMALQAALSLSQKESAQRKKDGKVLTHTYSWEKMAKETLRVYTSVL